MPAPQKKNKHAQALGSLGGKKGGKSKSKAKQKASRENAKKALAARLAKLSTGESSTSEEVE